MSGDNHFIRPDNDELCGEALGVANCKCGHSVDAHDDTGCNSCDECHAYRAQSTREAPDFSHLQFQYRDKNDADGPSFWWLNPWTGKDEKIASLWWPVHPQNETDMVDELFKRLRLTAY